MYKKVLVIGHNPDITRLFKEKLTQREFEVNIATSSSEGIIAAKEFKPDIILLDILNPDKDGFETLKELKKDPVTSQFPIILTSVIEDYMEEGLKLGAVDFLTKPFDFDKLLSTIENIFKGTLLKGKAVLVIDDDEAIVEMTKDYLESKNFKIFGALSGMEGISMLEKEKIGLIILDLKMPGMDGYEVIKIIKGNSLTDEIPIIVVTSVDIKECEEECLMLGVDGYFTKPCNSEILIGKINNLMERTIEKERQAKEFAKAKVLIADDEEIIRELVKDILENEGYELIVACDGKEAIAKIYAETPDILILDVKMPCLDGFEVCQKIREDALMNNLPIIMLTAKKTEKDEVKGLELGVDDYLTKPFKPAILLARVKAAFLRIHQGLDVNPLTYLPGNTSIARDIERRLKAKENFAVLYIDIDRFKAYNDYYGFHKGDEVIKATARILVDAVKKENYIGGFIGHIGGDDYICIVDDTKIDIICEEIIKKFDSIILDFYDEEVKKKGYITVENRSGKLERFSLMALSIGVVTTLQKGFSHIGEISKMGAELKKYAKKNEKSNYVLDRRM